MDEVAQVNQGVVTKREHRFRNKIPQAHKKSIDTRIAWLWDQRWGTVQRVYQDSQDTLDTMACTLILQAILGNDLSSIELLFQRLEGGAIDDQDTAERADSEMRV